ncbi:MAG: bifunctional methylenetetrahydrofolate dehydrogenase/methenyltetrahydrofolate cyclohydrolase FolD [Clostridiales bacterium]|uniref:bifunctional methylenetetrahydrofolate dehydrogenase/methenyltetrahydrofolate cyclohydrolase FolD n=1 Tax=Evtepia sp. TaxID=2773933 RepID=UPI0029838559|nr:bifunctional methylenetetrahydrofolate dehydrogenase/methenyltetrahydrofolate cyclohydrolase FolD [Evtepia sp.]MDD7289305.1 bifunctional methylenetetrahydrofolate dehydrogenase/methenyltetrahydrofolate cyclohydrolase FolD [Clostridiales bacterium]MDY4430694.1 bifunctional methylenetetrahydrofolate dehydrogenase/methenyltetrahydrofolate cyclohydrolase FolD [Evtepia sp.]
MAAIVLDGKALAAKCKEEVKKEAASLARTPGLAVIIVGNNPASRVYVNSKRKDCEECGFLSEEYALPEETTQEELIALIQQLNERADIDGILCQLPLPQGIDEEAVLMAISPDKDVDGFHPMNMGALLVGKEGFLPCTPYGIMEILDEYGIDPKGKQCVVIGRSNIVGKPMALLLLQRHGTVTICHSRTKNLAEVCRSADILVAAVGKVNIVTADMVKPGAVVIDVAMNRNEAGKLCGDVDYAGAKEVASAITPVPGGVGPMTRAMLMKNTLLAAKKHQG